MKAKDIEKGNILIQKNDIFIVKRIISEPCVVMESIHSEFGEYTQDVVVGESDLKDFLKLIREQK